ncbi:histidine kinase dimerization/phosphoacceptor domain -containing protein [Azospirillum sp. A39]|uniref:histidine kinase dimerization/phosphoacceptor domain -containing protein n=1 Tax=Azospirillum sp. A39 TaxID=3462279 RepID=UPI004045E38B
METEAHPAAPPAPLPPGHVDLLDATRTSPLPVALCAVDRPGRPIVYANDSFSRLTGRSAAELCGRGWDLLDAPEALPVSRLLDDALPASGGAVLDATLARAGGGPPVPCRLYVSTVPDRPFLLVQAVETGAPEAAPAAETLLRDLRHRVMNHLQFILSVLHMQSQRVEPGSTREALRDIAARIDTLAVVYRQLYATRTDSRIELAGYLGQLVSNLSAFYDRDSRIVLMIDAPDEDLLMPVERAFPLGLIVTELVVNSFKHAFHGRDDGSIAIAIVRPDPRHVLVTVRDDGPGLPDGGEAGSSKRLGLPLIRSLAAQIGGTVTMRPRPGAHIVITAPVLG